MTVMDADNYQEGIVRLIPGWMCSSPLNFFTGTCMGALDYEEGLKKLLEEGVDTAIVTLGSEGSVGMTKETASSGRKASGWM